MIHIFIVNPFAGRKNFADNLREKLKKISNIDYYIFNSRYPGHETELMRQVREIFDEDRLRIYCCGGSGTLRNILSGIDDFENIEIASFPCGMTNDFLKVFGEDEKRFSDIEELINGDVISVDYIKTTDGVCINTMSQGLDTHTVRVMSDLSAFQVIDENLPYFLGILYGILIGKHQNYYIETEFGIFEGNFMEMFVGNGHVLGGSMMFFDKADPTDGKLDVRIIKCGRGLLCIPYVVALLKNNQKWLDVHSVHGQTSFVKIKSRDGNPIPFNQDGEFIKDHKEWEARAVRRGLSFVVPKGVRLNNE